jgi:hypothetical protein
MQIEIEIIHGLDMSIIWMFLYTYELIEVVILCTNILLYW